MKVSLTILALVTTMELVLGVPVYGPPQPLPIPQKYRSPNGAPIPAKYPPHLSSHSGKNEFYSKFNPHSLPPGLRGPAPQLPPPFAKYPNLPPPGKHQQQYQQQNQYQHQHQLQHQPQQHQPQQHQPQQYQVHQHPQQQQQQQQQQHQQQPHHSPASSRPIGPQFQSKPHLLQNSAPHHPPQQGQVNNAADQRVQLAPSRPTPKITNVWTGPKLSGSPDFPPRFPTAATNIAPVTAVPFLEKPRGPYIINSDDERGPIKTIPAPNLNPADKPANFEEQLYRAQHQQSYVQPLDNSITDEKVSYQVTEDPNVYKQIGSQPSPTLESNPVPAVPLDIALQQHLDNQHQQQLSAEQVGSTGTLTPQELYSLLNGSPVGPAAAAVVPQTTYMVQQPVVYAVPQPQSLDLQAGHQLQYQPQPVQLQYAVQQPAATGVQLQYAQPAAADLQYLQPQTVQYHPQAVQYQPQTVQYQVQPEQQQQQQQQQQYQQQSAEQYNGAQKTATAAELSAQKQQQQQELIQQQQEQEQERQEHEQQQQREQLNQQQQQAEQQLQQQQQQQQQQPENDVQYQQEQDEYEPRNKGSVADEEHDQKKLQSIRDQYYSAVPNEQTAGVLAQIAQSAANNDEPSQADEPKAADKSPSDHQSAVQMHTSVQIQQSVPLYEATYASSRRTNQEYVDESPEADELMEGSESVAVSSESSPSSSVNGHAPNQFPYSAANINAFAAN